jgi:uncharacterized protein Yka (UPF0111/DUF47 family)
MMQNRKRKPVIAKPYDKMTLDEQLKYWQRYQKGLIDYLENEKTNFDEKEKVFTEIKKVKKKIDEIKETIRIDIEKSIFVEPIKTINQLY